MKKLNLDQLREKADNIRKDIIRIAVKNKAGHIAPSLSCVDILVSLYYRIMKIYNDPENKLRDRLIFSKAHGCYGLYVILADIGFISKDDINNFGKDGLLKGCCERNTKIGIEASCGSLGHGLPIAVGISFAAKLQIKNYRTYCVLGDGEMQEGSNWEAIQFAVKHKLSNLTLIIDNNKLQAMDRIETIMGKANLEEKFKAFGFKTFKCNGHNIDEIIETLKKCLNEKEKPQLIIADTIKGYSLKCMENIAKFHFRLPTDKELEII